jgi:small-conductance mechanosensitive channel
MNELLEQFTTWETTHALLSSPAFWRQMLVLGVAAVLAWLIGGWMQKRLTPVIRPGVVGESTRTAMRSGVLALVPLIMWLLLLGTKAVMRRHGMETDVVRTALLLVGALALIRMGVFVLRHSFSPGSRLKAWEGVLTATIWGLVALQILGWLPHIEEVLDEYALVFGATRISLFSLASFTLFVGLWLLVALWISNAIGWRVARSDQLDASLKIAISKLSKFVLLSVAVLGSMIAAGIDLTAFAVFGGALGVGLGLGLQRVISNFVSGIILAFEGSVKPGDLINVGQTNGTVLALHSRHIVVRTVDGLDILVPNENLLTTEITNWTYDDDRRVRMRMPIQISYQDDPARALEILVTAAKRHPRVLADPAPDALLLGFGDNGINLELRVWIEDPERARVNVQSEINLALWHDLRAAGMSFPFPQRDVRIVNAPAAPADSPSGEKPGSR